MMSSPPVQPWRNGPTELEGLVVESRRLERRRSQEVSIDSLQRLWI